MGEYLEAQRTDGASPGRGERSRLRGVALEPRASGEASVRSRLADIPWILRLLTF